MKARLMLGVVLGGLLLAALVFWSVPEVAAAKPPSFLEVGQVYDFHAANATLTGEVLELRSDGWIKIQQQGAGTVGWVNLDRLWGIKRPQ